MYIIVINYSINSNTTNIHSSCNSPRNQGIAGCQQRGKFTTFPQGLKDYRPLKRSSIHHK